MRFAWFLGGVVSVVAWSASAETPPEPPPERIEVPASLREPIIPLSEEVQAALTSGEYEAALEGVEALPKSSCKAFMNAFVIQKSGSEASMPPVRKVLQCDAAPKAYRAMVAAKLLMKKGKIKDAQKMLLTIPPDGPLGVEAMELAAENALTLGEEAGALTAMKSLADSEESVWSTRAAHLYVGQNLGEGAQPYLVKLWVQARGSAEADKAEALLRESGWEPSSADKLGRLSMDNRAGRWDRVLTESEELLSGFEAGSAEWCELTYYRSRANYKRNRLSKTVEAAGDGDVLCAESSQDFGKMITYLKGQALFRTKRFSESAETYTRLPDLYTETTYADDGLTRAGIAWVEAEEMEKAQALWERGLEEFPEGDTIPEAVFRLAFSHYLEGRTADAIAVAERLSTLSPEVDEVHVVAGMYWAARWKAWPEVSDPRALHSDAASVDMAAKELKALCEAYPAGYYGMMAFSRLQILNPEMAATLNRPAAIPAEGPWSVRTEVYNDPWIYAGVQMARLGFLQEANTLWSSSEVGPLMPQEEAWLGELRVKGGDWLQGHYKLHKYLRKHPVGTIGERESAIVRLAYPDRYWQEVQQYSASFTYEPRLFHALVREESNFNREIVSHAGAVGLSQLMPATARTTAGWLNKRVAKSQLTDPDINLELGTRYFEAVFLQMNENPFLSLAGYNAGPTRVLRWSNEWDNPPTDEFVERIPIRETRGYVKRVTSTWQVMRYHFDRERSVFPDLSPLVYQSVPPRD